MFVAKGFVSALLSFLLISEGSMITCQNQQEDNHRCPVYTHIYVLPIVMGMEEMTVNGYLELLEYGYRGGVLHCNKYLGNILLDSVFVKQPSPKQEFIIPKLLFEIQLPEGDKEYIIIDTDKYQYKFEGDSILYQLDTISIDRLDKYASFRL